MRKTLIVLFALLGLRSAANAQTAASCTWGLNPTATVHATASGNVTNVDEVIGSYFTSGISYHTSPAWQAILLNPGGVGTTLTSAHANGGYVEFRVSPLAGQTFTINSLSLLMGGNSNTFYSSIEYSLNSDFSNSKVIAQPTGIFPVTNTMYPLSYSLPDILLSPGQTLYLRIYGSHTQTVNRYMYINNLVLGGTTTADAGNVTVTDNGTTVTLNNGIVSVVVTKATGEIDTFNFNGANILSGGYSGGQFYWSWNMPNYQNPAGCTYTLTANPSSNGNTYAEIKLHMPWSGSTSTAAMDVDIYYSLKRNVSGLYATAKLSHPSSYPLNPGGEFRMASYPGSTYNWLDVDSARSRQMPTLADWNAAVAVTGAPKEVVRYTSGIFNNKYDCKYDYSADFGDINTWGWTSTTNYTGVWMTAPSKEYYPGGPMKRELMCHTSPVLLNMVGGTHYGGGTDGGIAAGETWSKIYGPFLIYCNKVASGTSNANTVLWNDAKTQALAEQAQWPYSWLTESTYAQASGRGTVTGTLAISDPDSPSPANIWVGVAVTPSSTIGSTNFQQWTKNYQFWVKTDASGNFTIPNVLPGTYNLYAFGPGVIGQLTLNNYLTVTAGSTTALGTVTWTPDRVAPTIWHIGTPDRSSKEFKHGTDYWNETAIYPDTTWANFMKYHSEFPSDVNYTIGTSTPANDWNYVQPYNLVGTAQTVAPAWKVNFNLTTAPTSGSNSSLYVSAAASNSAPVYVIVNGTNITTPTTGVFFAIASDATIRMANHGAFSDLRFTFPSSLLVAGANTISITNRKSGTDVQYDYIRLESPGTSSTVASLSSMAPASPGNNSTSTDTRTFAFPNPATSNLNVQFMAPQTGTAQCAIIDTRGVTIRKFDADVLAGKNLLMADVSGLTTGIYFIRINCGGQVNTIKFIKQ